MLRSRDPIDHSRTRRGENREQASGTFAGEEASSSKATPAPEEEEGFEAPAIDGGTGSAAGTAAARALAGGGEGGGAGAGTVTGLLVGDGSEPVVGAPGLRSGKEAGAEPGVALGIGALALLAGLGGVWLERRRRWAPIGAPA